MQSNQDLSRNFISRLVDDLIDPSRRGNLLRRLLFILIVAPVVTMTVLNYRQSRQELTNLTASQRKATVQSASATLSERFTRISDVGTAFAARNQFRQLITLGSWEPALNQLDETSESFPFIDQMFLADPAGNLMAVTGSDKSIIGKNFAYRDWYKGVSKDWSPYISEVYQRANLPKRNVITVAVPIRTDRGEVLGILALQTRLEELFNWVQKINTEPEEFIYIVDRRGNVALHPKYPVQGEIINFSTVPAVQKALRGESSVAELYNPVEQQKRLVAYTPVTPYGWAMLVAQPINAAYATRDKQLATIMFQGMFLTGLTAAIAYLLLRLINTLSAYRQKEKAFLQSIGDGLVAIDDKWTITLWNTAATELTGWSGEEAIGKPFKEIVRFIRESDNSEHYEFIDNAMKTGTVRSMENHTLLVRKDGSKITVGDSAAPIFNQARSVSGVIIIFRDMTKDYEIQKIKEGQQRFVEDVLKKLPVGIIVAEAPSGELTMFNDMATEILGQGIRPNAEKSNYTKVYPVEKLDGSPYPNEELPVNIALSQAKSVEDVELIVVRPDGIRTTVRCRAEPIFDQQGKVASAIVTFEDISEAKQLEQSKNEFFSIASHELRTPLTAIRGDASMMLQYYADKFKDDPDLKGMVEDIYAGSVRLIELVNDFLDSSRLEQGRIEFKISDFDIIPVINNVLGDIKSVADAKGLELKLTSASQEFKVNGDSDRLKQILFNLVGNALKFTDKGTVTVDLQPEGDNLKLRVIDNGAGIRADKQQLLFQKFQQAGRSTMTGDVTKGSGLGLYISKMLAEGMGSKLELESSIEGQGSTFTLTLPLAKNNESTGDNAGAVAPNN